MSERNVLIKLESITDYSSSFPVTSLKPKNESHDDFEKRTWREKAHATEAGNVYIPGVSFKLALDETASLLNEKIPSKGSQTWSGAFRSGVAAVGDVDIGVKLDKLKAIPIYAHANGQRKSGKRVTRWFPIVSKWKGEVLFKIFNEAIQDDIFERYFTQAGVLAGVGRGRPITGCAAGNGRFRPLDFRWS